jgi:hypothetical protein
MWSPRRISSRAQACKVRDFKDIKPIIREVQGFLLGHLRVLMGVLVHRHADEYFVVDRYHGHDSHGDARVNSESDSVQGRRHDA